MDDHHDPRKEIEKLRESLGSHDKPLAFLIGAGASCAAEDSVGDPLIPALEELARRCKEAVASLGVEQNAAYDLIGNELKERNGRKTTVEDVLSSVREKIAAMTDADKLFRRQSCPTGLNRGGNAEDDRHGRQSGRGTLSRGIATPRFRPLADPD